MFPPSFVVCGRPLERLKSVMSLWQSASATESVPDLLTSEVHIWRSRVDLPHRQVQALSSVLSREEKSKAHRFVFDRDRARYIVSHGVLRQVLSGYLSVEPHQLTFRAREAGRPELSGEFEGSAVRFNLSHSRNMALLAFTRVLEVGVDIEFMAPLPNVEALAAKHFSEKELKRLRSSPRQQKMEVFYSCWTRREACLKASGDGFRVPMKTVEVFSAPKDTLGSVPADNDPNELKLFKLVTLYPEANYISAIAAEGRGWDLRLFDYRAGI